MSEFKQLIYIASVGFSGSTLLDMLLGANSGITALGEVSLLAKFARENRRCTCGATVPNCPFWSRVDNRLRRTLGTPLSAFDLGSQDLKQTIFRKLPTATDMALILGSSGLWRALCSVDRHAALYRQGARNSTVIYSIACDMEGSDAVVDSSKYALLLKARYLELQHRMKIIFLVRDGRAVSKSLVKREGLEFSHAARKWARFNWNLELVMQSIPKRQILRMRYEDLCRDPSGALVSLSAFLARSKALEVRPLLKERYHDIGGNPMRHRREETAIRLDESWKQSITDEELRIFASIAAKTNRRYGYN